MPSPFPGMNPYLEQETVWHGFHQQFVPLALQLLVPQVRPHYVVKLEEHIYIQDAPDERTFIGKPDVAVMDWPARGREHGGGGSATTAPAHARIHPAAEVERLSYLEIRNRTDMRLVTVIELLSPSNKRPGRDREAYLVKRARILASEVHLIEIDLLRGDARLPLLELPECDYYAMVSRAEERPDVGIWPIELRAPLPKVPVPLRPPHPDAHLDLQEMLHQLYDAGGYADYIYDGQPNPPLRPDDASWAVSLVGAMNR